MPSSPPSRRQPAGTGRLRKQPDNASIYREVHSRIAAMVKSGQLRPGHLLSVMQIARAFGISRSSVRQALELLAREGVVNQVPRKGYIVTGRRRGRIDPAEVKTYAFDPVAISTEPSWRRIYKDLEREVATRMLFRKVRVTEDRLSQHFAVSRTVVREALAQLAANGLISKDVQGHWVADKVSIQTLRNLYQLRRLLEPAALLDSAPKLPRETIDEAWRRLNATIARFPKVGSAELDQLEQDLHGGLLVKCANKPLLRVLDQTRLLIIATRYIFDDYLSISAEISKQTALEHLLVVECLRAGEYTAAAQALSEHLRKSLDHWIHRLENLSLVEEPPMPDFLAPADAA